MGQYHAKAIDGENTIKQIAARATALINPMIPSPVKHLGWRIK
jgi:hypothetical protein